MTHLTAVAVELNNLVGVKLTDTTYFSHQMVTHLHCDTIEDAKALAEMINTKCHRMEYITERYELRGGRIVPA